MSKQLVVQNDFSGGEVSSNILGRFNTELYAKSVSRCENMIPLPQGPVISRPPLQYRQVLPYYRARLERYSSKKDMGASGDDMLAVFVAGKVYAYKNGVQMLDGAGVALEAVTPFLWTELDGLSVCQFEYYMVVVHPSHGIYALVISDDIIGSPTPDPYIQFQKCTFTATTGAIYGHLYTSKPALCAVFDGRLYFASTARSSSVVIATAVPPFTDTTYQIDISETTGGVMTAANAFMARLTGSPLWMAEGKDLVIGTAKDERIIPSGTNALNFSAKIQTWFGSSAIKPIVCNDSLVFVGPDNRSLREYFYRDEGQSYQSPRLDIAADHLIDRTRQIVYQSGELPIIWILDTATRTRLVGIIHDRNYDVTSFFELTNGNDIESIAVVRESGIDVLYAVVRLAGTKGILVSLADWRSVITYAYQLDYYTTAVVSGGIITISATAAEILNGRTVKIYKASDLATLAGSAVVSGTEIATTIPNDTAVIVGIEYECRLILNPPAVQAKVGPAFLRPKAITGATLFLEKSVPPKLSLVDWNGSSWTMSSIEDVASGTYPITGEVEIPIQSTWAANRQLHIVKTSPAPMKIIAVTTEVDAGG